MPSAGKFPSESSTDAESKLVSNADMELREYSAADRSRGVERNPWIPADRWHRQNVDWLDEHATYGCHRRLAMRRVAEDRRSRLPTFSSVQSHKRDRKHADRKGSRASGLFLGLRTKREHGCTLSSIADNPKRRVETLPSTAVMIHRL